MTDFKMLKVSDKALYWFEVASYISPYATVGSFILSGFALASEHRQERRLVEMSRKLDEIKILINQTRRALEQKLEDIPLRERTGEVLGIEEALNEYRALQSQGILDNIISDSAQTKNKIKTFIDADDTPVDYRVMYCGLYATLLPLRVAAFELFDRPINDINPLVKSENEDLATVEAISISSAETVGSNRVSSRHQEERFLYDELGPVFGTNFYVTVDNTRRNLGTFIPRQGDGDLNAIRSRAQQSRDELAQQKARKAAAPFRQVFDASRAVLATLP